MMALQPASGTPSPSSPAQRPLGTTAPPSSWPPPALCGCASGCKCTPRRRPSQRRSGGRQRQELRLCRKVMVMLMSSSLAARSWPHAQSLSSQPCKSEPALLLWVVLDRRPHRLVLRCHRQSEAVSPGYLQGCFLARRLCRQDQVHLRALPNPGRPPPHQQDCHRRRPRQQLPHRPLCHCRPHQLLRRRRRRGSPPLRWPATATPLRAARWRSCQCHQDKRLHCVFRHRLCQSCPAPGLT